MAQRQHVGRVARQIIALFTRHRLLLLRIIFSKTAAKIVDQRQVETIQPDNRFLPRIAVVMPAPLRRENKIAGAHGRALAIDGGKRAMAFHNKAQRRLVMTVA